MPSIHYAHTMYVCICIYTYIHDVTMTYTNNRTYNRVKYIKKLTTTVFWMTQTVVVCLRGIFLCMLISSCVRQGRKHKTT